MENNMTIVATEPAVAHPMTSYKYDTNLSPFTALSPLPCPPLCGRRQGTRTEEDVITKSKQNTYNHNYYEQNREVATR